MTLSLLAELTYRAFDVCPICLSPGPDSDEHVPNEALGGKIQTLTCTRCNNDLGSNIEPHLEAFCTGRFQYVRFNTRGLPGRRLIPRLDTLWTEDGQFVVLAALDPEARAALGTAEKFTLEIRERDMSRVKAAALKHSYLAACIAMGEVPTGPRADEIRRVLLAARDFDRDAELPNGDALNGIEVWRTHTGPAGPGLALMGRTGNDGSPELWISLAGAVAVRWPLPDSEALVLAAAARVVAMKQV